MGKVHRLLSTQNISVPLETAWKFFSDPNNLLTITPPFLNLRVTNDTFGNEAYAGQIISYRVKPLLGISLSWVTEITHVEKEKMFVDEQRQGPYKLWHHQHHFKTVEGGTQMTDIVHYRLPFGAAGDLAHPLVKKKLLKIFDFRYQKVVEIFGAWSGDKMEVRID